MKNSRWSTRVEVQRGFLQGLLPSSQTYASIYSETRAAAQTQTPCTLKNLRDHYIWLFGMEGDKSCPEHYLTAVYENVSMSCNNIIISNILLTDLSRSNVPLTCFILRRHFSRKSLEHIKCPFNNLENSDSVLNARIDPW